MITPTFPSSALSTKGKDEVILGMMRLQQVTRSSLELLGASVTSWCYNKEKDEAKERGLRRAKSGIT